jgi:DNA-binding NarL/FixJ family response regulator
VPEPLRIVIADDTPAMSSFLRELIGGQDDMEVVGVAADVETAIGTARLQRPDVVLLDVRMPGGGGEVAAPAIRALLPKGRIVALSTFSEQSLIDAMLSAGADAYVVKGANVQAILDAVRG